MKRLIIASIILIISLLMIISPKKSFAASCVGNTKCAYYDIVNKKVICGDGSSWYTVGCGGMPTCYENACDYNCDIGTTCHCDADPTSCGNCSVSCGGGTQTCTNGCSSWSQACNTQACPPACNTTAPTNLSVTRVSPTSSTLSWTPGANGTSQRVYVGANLTEVTNNCPGTNTPLCVVSATGLPTSQTSYSVSTLSSGTVYYYKVLNYKDAGCSTASAISTSVSSCDVTPSTMSIQVGSVGTLTTTVNSSSSISSVNYVSANTSTATVNPASDLTYPYQTSVTGVAIGSTSVTSNVIIGGATNCSANSTVNVIPPNAWWQVMDADITTNGDISSPIPGSCSLPTCNPVLGLKGAGGFPGVPAYGGTTADFLSGAGNGNAAESPYNWLANSRYNGRVYDYAYFERQIPDDVVFNELTPPVTGGTFNSGGSPSRGYIWYHWDGATLGDLTINGNVNLVGSRRVVLMVEGANLIIDGRIQLQNPGQGFFMAVVGKDSSGLKGDIMVDPSIDTIEGIFLAEGEFKTGVASSQFAVRGSVAAYEGVVLERDLGTSNSDTPAEVFTYAPDIIATFPSVFTQKRIRWKEVAP